MEKFSQGEIKILTCTNIVESGLDIQNANTIIIQDVQQFGLAQLYQVLFFLFSVLIVRVICENLIFKIVTWVVSCSFINLNNVNTVVPELLNLIIHVTNYVSFVLCFPLNGNSFGEGWGGQIRKLMHTYFTQRSHF